MRDILASLILEEIRFTGLIRSLQDLGIDATDYLPETSNIIFELANIEVTEELSDHYFQMIERNVTTKEERMKLADEIVCFLLTNQLDAQKRKVVSS